MGSLTGHTGTLPHQIAAFLTDCTPAQERSTRGSPGPGPIP